MTDRLPIVASLLAACLLASPALAQTGSAAPVSAPASTGAVKKTVDPRLDDQAIICKRQDATGTRLGGEKECHTRAEWASRSASAHEEAARMINTPQTH